VITKLMQANVF